jgi:dihydroorotate dehydrogenase (fumarate)
MIDLTTRYLGLTLPSPLVLSAGPLTEDLDTIRRAEDAGAGGVVLPSLFEEQLDIEGHDLDEQLTAHAHTHAEATTYLPHSGDYALGPDAYLEHIRRAKAAVRIPVVASLNGVSKGGWTDFARDMQQAGADALELNVFHLPTDPQRTGAAVEADYVALVRNVRQHIRIPLAVKLPHFFSAIANVASELVRAGANGLALFNRFYQPDIDLEQLEVVPNLTLSSPAELRLRLRWVAILYGRVSADLAVTGGVHSAEDVLKATMAGAACAMMTSALLQRGVPHLATVLADLHGWMEQHEYESIRQMQGSMSQQRTADPAAFERANYLKVLRSYAVRPRPPILPAQ